MYVRNYGIDNTLLITVNYLGCVNISTSIPYFAHKIIPCAKLHGYICILSSRERKFKIGGNLFVSKPSLFFKMYTFVCSLQALSSGQFRARSAFPNVLQMFISPEGICALVVPCCCVILACNARQPIKKLVHVKLSFPGIVAN